MHQPAGVESHGSSDIENEIAAPAETVLQRAARHMITGAIAGRV